MKSATILTALFALNIGSAALVRAADTYKIDPMHSTVGFSVKHMVINNVKGKFTDFNGTVVVDNNALQEAKGTIQSKSVDTGIPQRDNDLRSANFFDATK